MFVFWGRENKGKPGDAERRSGRGRRWWMMLYHGQQQPDSWMGVWVDSPSLPSLFPLPKAGSSRLWRPSCPWPSGHVGRQPAAALRNGRSCAVEPTPGIPNPKTQLMSNLTLAEMIAGSFRELSEGSVVKGKILEIKPQVILVDIGYKSEGAIPSNEFEVRHPGRRRSRSPARTRK